MELEEIMEELDRILEGLQDPNQPLEQVYQKFSRGVQLVKEGNEAIGKVEQQMKLLEEKDIGVEEDV